MTVRPDVVSLLADLRPDVDAPPNRWTHLDGSPITADEVDLVGSATRDELLAVRDYIAKAADHAEEQTAHVRRANQLCAPYWPKLDAGATTADVAAAMPEHERAELAAVLGRIDPA